MSKDKDSKQQKNESADLPEVTQELSKVATNPKQNLLILGIISAIFIYLVFNLFTSDEDANPKKETTPIPEKVTKPIQVDEESDIPPIPTLPSPPKLEDLTPPPPPPETEELPTSSNELPPLPESVPTEPSSVEPSSEPSLPLIGQQQDDEARKRVEAKRKSSIILVAGTPPKKTADQMQQEADFKYRGDMNLVLGRGKIIDAIIETAINTDTGGEIRAVISRDIYSEWGRNILIPKGSRVFGDYSTNINGMYGRISINWTRIDLANGYTVNLSGSGIDALGRKGNHGRVDNKFKERLSNAILKSTFNIAFANVLDSVVKPQINSETAANRNIAAAAIKSLATQIFTQAPTPGITADADAGIKIGLICSQVPASITDKTSDTFVKITSACSAIQANPAGSNVTKLQSLMNSINSSGDALLQNTIANVEETKAQKASKQAFNDVGDVIKSVIEEQEFKPTITIDQGTPVKIYVNKDYKFPKNAVKKARLMK